MPTQAPPPATDVDSLVNRLRAAGLAVDVKEKVAEFYFSVTGTVLQVGGQVAKVFEYANAEAANADASRVSPDGTTVEVPANGGIVAHSLFWVATPHFYKSGKVIALYVGDEARIAEGLEGALSPQFAGQ